MVEVPDNYETDSLEPAIESHWESINAYEKTKDAHTDDPTYYFLDGPPYVSGTTHLGTGWNKVLKDQMIRYRRMQGHQVTDRPGYDMHGLPIETKVEEDMGFETKTDILEFGVEEFIERCKEFAGHYRQEMELDFKSLGVWMDWENAYETPTTEYIEAAWWSIKKIDENGLVAPSDRIINWCPRCQTALADAEVEYDVIESPSIYVKFPLVDENASLVAWTTTPWTIPANQYIAVDGEASYARIRVKTESDSEVLIVAEECVNHLISSTKLTDAEILETFKGKNLRKKRYTHPLESSIPKQEEFRNDDITHRVYAADFVTTERTGIVHSAPGHGEEDYEFGKKRGFSLFSPVDDNGEFTKKAGKYAGTRITQGFETGAANAEIISDLRKTGALLTSERTEHRYGHCWRCDADVILRATNQWFIQITEKQDVLLEQLEESEWYPMWARDNRFRNWVEGARDWCFSRQRYWGIPIPIWVPEEGPREEYIIVASSEELAERADQEVTSNEIDLHRPVVDQLTITENETTYRRIPDIFDVWFESGVANLASIDFPENKAALNDLWPADLIIEAHDQTRGWFWSQLQIGVAAFDKVPYENVVMHGFLNDAEGDKMSKSVGNIAEPGDARDRYGVDPTRLYLLSHNPQGVDFDFHWEGISEAKRRLNIVWNSLRFAEQYMTLDEVEPTAVSVPKESLETADRWILARLQTVTSEMTEDMESYNSHLALNTVMDFLTEDFSRFYIQTIRSRVWEERNSPTKQAAYATMAQVLLQCSRLLAPFTPYLSEAIYQELGGSEATVHMLLWPKVEKNLSNNKLEKQIEVVRKVEEAGMNARQQAERGLRWPVEHVTVSGDESVVEAVSDLETIVRERLNTKQIETMIGEWEGTVWRVDPKMSELGPEFGSDANAVADSLSEYTREEFRASPRIDIGDKVYKIEEDMVSFIRETPENVLSSEFEGGVVYLDMELNDEVLAEGYANEIIRRIQQLRKELDLDIDSKIRTAISVEDHQLESSLNSWMDHIASETRSAQIKESLEEPKASLSEEVHDVSFFVAIRPVE